MKDYVISLETSKKFQEAGIKKKAMSTASQCKGARR